MVTACCKPHELPSQMAPSSYTGVLQSAPMIAHIAPCYFSPSQHARSRIVVADISIPTAPQCSKCNACPDSCFALNAAAGHIEASTRWLPTQAQTSDHHQAPDCGMSVVSVFPLLRDQQYGQHSCASVHSMAQDKEYTASCGWHLANHVRFTLHTPLHCPFALPISNLCSRSSMLLKQPTRTCCRRNQLSVSMYLY
jgi:hypothetical protein